ncbi:hypothetical protein [Rhodopirellula sp. MGV]|uniref:hypothetical protein n=1 Tax=Rhodopirellula sp. MGV TaxID=2023130 RepID=UPI001E5DEE03|nr:hypothetical protein [Rhodopirellula sp. MGV]
MFGVANDKVATIAAVLSLADAARQPNARQLHVGAPFVGTLDAKRWCVTGFEPVTVRTFV